MKKNYFLIILLSILALMSCTERKYNLIESRKLKFNEGTVVYDSYVLSSNFGTDELNPLSTEGKGYILRTKGKRMRKFIPADGNLSAPKGMAIKDDYLYIADVGKVVVYNLDDRSLDPIIVNFPEGNLFLNDVAISGNTAYVSVTNTGKVFKMDISNPSELNSTMVSEYIDVVGANGLVIDGNKMYIASYPADGITTDDNVIYKVEDMTAPVVERINNRKGQYDGLAISGNKLFFTNWVGGEVGYVDLTNLNVYSIGLPVDTNGAADISLFEGKLYIPILPSSQILVVDMANF